MKPPARRARQSRPARKRTTLTERASAAAAQPLMDELLEPLLLALAPIEPSPARKLALEARILRRARQEEAPGEIHYQSTVTIRASGGEWTELAPGVLMKRLHRDGQARSYLLRLAPGAALPMHHHTADEECVVLEGEVYLDELRVATGDYHLARGGTTHGQIRSPQGALLFLRSASGVSYPL